MNKPTKILAISGSLRENSFSTKILKHMGNFAPENVTFTLTDKLEKLPHFNPDIDQDQAYAEVEAFRTELKSADGVIISTPEYAKGIPGVLKNALDWIVSSGEFIDKPTAVISASPMTTGGEEAMRSLLLTLGMINAHIPDGATLGIPQVSLKIDKEGNINDPSLKKDLEQILSILVNK
ncbi:NAD(P)H-dependent oxidoreductase [Shimazuella sp. AN120528]|uniref:NADPH-dependent FMN reductase n=1 Tax=Shimazuella soli TaxID=1892854 RepID=UPI001F0CE9C7|nr:NADPH-dependent FMN reductase [Shimazuella soli]MCH5583639.1 NAD(P)H-dependent oxidoreductase [Shimazuella soli]